jgi:hypothetical protein
VFRSSSRMRDTGRFWWFGGLVLRTGTLRDRGSGLPDGL